LGLKTSFLGGKVSTDFAWFHMTSTNNTVRAPNLPNGYTYSILVGNTVEEGVDGDVAFALVPGWQLIGNFYAGHDRDYNNNPLSGTYDNDLSLFTRYDFSHSGPLKGLSFGGGLSRVGGKWITSSQIISPYPLPSVIKFQIGTLVDTFANYQFNRHFIFKIGCNNILNQAYPYGNQTSSEVDPSPPRTWVLSGAYKF
jgi:outer membrane receptor for ferric coprogen and ferric-rhodotorulic acid